MNYTKFLKGTKSHNKFSLLLNDEKIKMSISISKDIKKTGYIIRNFNKLDNKIDLDEFFAYFLQDKNEFINEFKNYIEKSDIKKLNM